MDHAAPAGAVILADGASELARIVGAAYAECLQGARIVSFFDEDASAVMSALDTLQSGDLAVLVQSESFRLPNYRIRVELYKRGVKVIEHSNLARIDHHEIDTYLDSLAYDPAYYRGIGHALKAKIDAAQTARVQSGGETLVYEAGLEPAKINIGDFATLANVGSQFPIGEVFTEAKDLTQVHGKLCIYGFTDLSVRLNVPENPITLTIEHGRIVATAHANEAFDAVLARIREDEGDVWIRELGFGMNRAFSRERRVADVGAFERACGIHVSIGAKHGVYKKPHLKHKEARHHVDVFALTERVWLDEAQVFADGAWQL